MMKTSGKIDVAIAEQGEKLINLSGNFNKGLADRKPSCYLPPSVILRVALLEMQEGQWGCCCTVYYAQIIHR